MAKFARAAMGLSRERLVSISDVRIVGFDSFQGLPDKVSPSDEHLIWRKGQFAQSSDAALRAVRQTGFPMDQVVLIEGFFDETLNPRTAERIWDPSPSIINIDVDYYSSTKRVLEFLAPMLKSGAVLHFDDLWSFHGHPGMGQLRAIREFPNRVGFLTPCAAHDHRGKTFLYSAATWEWGNEPAT